MGLPPAGTRSPRRRGRAAGSAARRRTSRRPRPKPSRRHGRAGSPARDARPSERRRRPAGSGRPPRGRPGGRAPRVSQPADARRRTRRAGRAGRGPRGGIAWRGRTLSHQALQEKGGAPQGAAASDSSESTSADQFLINVAEAVWVRAPLTPVMVSGKVARGVILTVTLRAEVAPVAGFGVKVAVAPEGRPATERVMA